MKYRFIYDKDSGYDDNPQLLLIPAEKELAQLPYLTECGKPEQATQIQVENLRDAATRLLSKQLAAELTAGKYPEVSGTARIVVDGFLAGYECDSPFFSTRFVSVAQVVMAAAATPLQRKHGC